MEVIMKALTNSSWFITTFLCTIAFVLSNPVIVSAELAIPITIQEALPANVDGLPRASAPVTVGIPLPADSGVTDVNQLGVSGVAAAQFRAIGWWPSGNIKWVLVDFQKDVSPGVSGSVSLVGGTGSFGGLNLATEKTAEIVVNTGAAEFRIRKANFNIFDAVSVGGQSLLPVGNAGGMYAVGADGLSYSSRNDNLSTAKIEENGPVRSVVKASGSFKNAAGARLMDYTVRLHFYKGSSKVKGIVTLRNAALSPKTHAIFKSVEAVVPLTITGQKTATFSRNSDVVSRPLVVGDTAYLYQGYNVKQMTTTDKDCFNYTPPIPGTCPTTYVFQPDVTFQGLKVVSGAEVLNASGDPKQASQGFADFSNSNGVGVAVAFRWLSGYWPGGFEFKENGSTSIELYSKYNGDTNIKLAYGRHDTREIMWDFHTVPKDGKEILYALQYPVVARAPFDHYKQSKAVFGQQELVSVGEEEAFFSSQGKAVPTFPNPAMSTVFRSWQWSKPGGDNQIQFPLIDMYEFLRTGNAGYYLRGEQRTWFNLDSGIGFSDDYVGFNRMSPPATDPYPALKGLAGGLMDTEHAHMMSIPFYYFLTGDERIREGFLDAGETIQKSNEAGYYPIPTTPFIRAWSWQIRNMVLAYEFSCQVGACNESLKTTVMNSVNYLIDSRENGTGTKLGRNLQRGFLYWNDLSNGSRMVHTEYYSQMHFEAMWQVWRVMNDGNWGYGRMLEFEDYLSGLSQFIFNELVRPVKKDDVFYGFPVAYPYALEKDYPLEGPAPVNAVARVFDASRPAIWEYQHSGDTTALDKGNALVWSLYEEVPQNPSELQGQAIMWVHHNLAAVPVWTTLDAETIVNPDGTYTLKWLVPFGAVKYQIKYSDKDIVESLRFGRETRTYQYDPAKHVPFFAATNIKKNPAPAPVQTTQSLTLGDLPPNQKFMVKCLVKPVPKARNVRIPVPTK